jgi:hypothetical protein
LCLWRKEKNGGGNGFDADAASVMFKRLVKEESRGGLPTDFCSFVLLRKFETCASFFETFYVMILCFGEASEKQGKERKGKESL